MAGRLQNYRSFFGQAEKIDVDPSNGFNLPFDSKAESDAYIQKQLINVLDASELESLKKMVFHSGLGRGIVIYINGFLCTLKEK